MRTLVISLAAAAATAAPAFAQPPNPTHASAHVAAIVWHSHTMATGDTASDPSSRSAQNEAWRDPSRSTGTPQS